MRGVSKPGRIPVGQMLAMLATLLLVTAGIGVVQAQDNEGQSQIIGKIISSHTGEPLPFASLVLHELESPTDSVGTLFRTILAKNDGSYRTEVPAGHYKIRATYVAYNPKMVVGIEVPENGVVTANITLVPTAVNVETVEVTSFALENSEASILAHQRKAAAVSDGVSAQQISQSTDSDAAEVLQRVTGLSVVGGRYVYVRGLGERYSSTQIDGAKIGTPEPNKRVVPLDLFAAGLLDNVVVQKTYTPDKPGDFGGGVVNVNTRDFPGQRAWSFSLSSGYNSGTTGKDFFTYEGGSLDFLGIDDGARQVPDLVTEIAHNTRIVDRGGFPADTLEMLGESFKNNWKMQKKTSVVPYSFKLSYGDEVEFLSQPLGFLGSVSLSNSFKTYDRIARGLEISQGTLFPERDYKGTTSEQKTLWGVLGNVSYRLNSFNTVSLRTMYNRSAEDEVRFLEGPNEDHGLYWRNVRYRYVERGLFSTSLATNHYIAPLGGSTVELRYNYSHSNRDEPDRHEYNYERESDTVDGEQVYVYRLSTRTNQLRPLRHFGTMQEDHRQPEFNITVPFRQWNSLESRFKTGVSYEDKSRDFRWRRFYFKEPSYLSPSKRDSIFALPPEVLLSEDNIGGTRRDFRLLENTFPETDNYKGSQEITSTYFMFDLPIFSKLRSVFGVRYEEADVVLQPYNPYVPADEDTLSSRRHKYSDWLPSVNLTYALSYKTNIRLAYSGTINRPEFRELSPFFIADLEGGYLSTGNLDLERAWIDSYDLRFETYPSPSELFALSFFYKELENPIEKAILGGGRPLIQPQNVDRGTLYGGEVEGRLGLDRISEPLRGFAFSGNWTLVESETERRDVGIQHTSKPPLAGQSPYVLNLGVFYATETGRTTASILYNVFGRRLEALGVQDEPDIYEMPRHMLDLSVNHMLGSYKFKLSLENLLDDEVRYEQQQPLDGKWVARHISTRGRSISLSVSVGS